MYHMLSHNNILSNVKYQILYCIYFEIMILNVTFATTKEHLISHNYETIQSKQDYEESAQLV